MIGIELIYVAMFNLSVCSLVIATLIACFYTKLTCFLQNRSFSKRLYAFLFLAIFPAIFTFLLILSSTIPSILNCTKLTIDKCLFHVLPHSHLCLVHPIDVHGGLLGFFLVSIISLNLLTNLYDEIKVLNHMKNLYKVLYKQSNYDPIFDVHVINSQKLFVFTAGFFQNRIYISSKLKDSLNKSDLETVLLHEEGHKYYRHSLLKIFASLFSLFLFPKVRIKILEEINLAMEQQADHYSAKKTGDSVMVAQVLINLKRLFNEFPSETPIGAFAYINGSIHLRITSLININKNSFSILNLFIFMFFLSILIVSNNNQVHFFTNDIMSYFIGE